MSPGGRPGPTRMTKCAPQARPKRMQQASYTTGNAHIVVEPGERECGVVGPSFCRPIRSSKAQCEDRGMSLGHDPTRMKNYVPQAHP